MRAAKEPSAVSGKTHILWDHDGVLVHTEPWYFAATQEAILPLGVRYSQRDCLADNRVGRSAWERARALGVGDAAIAAQKAERDRQYQRYLATEPIEIPGVDAVLAELASSYAMAIVTTAKKSDFALIHAERKILGYMDFVLANGDYARSKPAPDPYLAALDRFGVNPGQAVVVEDSARGLGSAVAAGIDCVIVDNEFMRGQDTSAARWHINSLAELPALLGA